MLATFLGPRRPKRPPRRSRDASKAIPRAPQDPIPPGLMGYPCFGRDQNKGTPSPQVVFWYLKASIFVPPGVDFERTLFDLNWIQELLASILTRKRGGGIAALRRVGSAPGPKAPSCVSASRVTRSLHSLSLHSLSYTHSHTLTLCKQFFCVRFPSLGSLRLDNWASPDPPGAAISAGS